MTRPTSSAVCGDSDDDIEMDVDRRQPKTHHGFGHDAVQRTPAFTSVPRTPSNPYAFGGPVAMDDDDDDDDVAPMHVTATATTTSRSSYGVHGRWGAF